MHKLNNDIQMFQGGLGGLGRLGGGTTETGTRVCGFDVSPSLYILPKIKMMEEEVVES